jgi:hypothetical protein
MVLHDGKYSRYLIAIGLLVAGVAIACLFGRQKFAAILVGVACVGAGGFLLYTTKRVTIELNRATGKINILLRSLKQKEERELGIAEVKKIVLRKFIQTSVSSDPSSTSGRSVKTYYQFMLVFVTNHNEELPFDFGRVSAGITNLIVSPDDKKRQAAEQIASFIGVPLDAALPSVRDVLSAIKESFAGRLQRTS